MLIRTFNNIPHHILYTDAREKQLPRRLRIKEEYYEYFIEEYFVANDKKNAGKKNETKQKKKMFI